ncbi:VOC family protein [Cucumibacter marinus]|uniref:VOC family protein n=1 Tax=Cucumibacter marinus TaxID=1121252 RepID=UPI00041AD888|nr:VOC family protein [Cucumibacter marinus]
MFVQFAELPVLDQARAKAFYVEKLGCEVVADAPMGPDGWHWVEIGFPGESTHLHFVRRSNEDPSEDPVLVLVDSDVEGRVSELRNKGVEIVTAPHEPEWQPGRTVAEFRDSEGNRIIIATP